MKQRTALLVHDFQTTWGNEITITYNMSEYRDNDTLRLQLRTELENGRDVWYQIKDLCFKIRNSLNVVHPDIIQASDYIHVICNGDNDEKDVDQQAVHNSDKTEEYDPKKGVYLRDEFDNLFPHSIRAKFTYNEGVSDKDFERLQFAMQDDTILFVIFKDRGDNLIYDYTPHGIDGLRKANPKRISVIYLISPSVGDKAASDVPSYYCNLAQNEDDKCGVQCDECRKHELAGADLNREDFEESKQKVAEADTIISLSRKTVWDLKMHEDMTIRDNFFATRVPGGWIYELYDADANQANTTFIPYVDQIHNTGCTLCGNNNKRMAHQILDVLNHLNDNQASIDSDGDLLKYIEEYLNTST